VQDWGGCFDAKIVENLYFIKAMWRYYKRVSISHQFLGGWYGSEYALWII